jgi:hypothetical protein
LGSRHSPKGPILRVKKEKKKEGKKDAALKADDVRPERSVGVPKKSC